MTDVTQNCLPLDATLRDVLQRLNAGVGGVVLMVDGDTILKGLFTDGDVRRALLHGASLEESADEYMTTDFTAGHIDFSREANVALLSERIRHLPILDAEGRPVDLLSWADLWRVPVMEPSLGGNEIKYVTDCIASGWISSKGSYVTRFEEAFAEYLGVKYALTTSNGTTALHLALVAMGIEAGDEVIVPNLTFGASANVVVHCGATPMLVDVDPETWNLDAEQLEAAITPQTKAIMPVHLYGHPTEMTTVLEIANRHNLLVLEDAAEALGAQYRGQFVGGLGDAGAFSFFANKIITTGEGGMVVTNDDDLYDKMVVMRAHGMRPMHRYWHEYAGYNYRLTNIQAAIGLAQLERLDEFLAYREQVVARYHEYLSEVNGLILPPNKDWARNVFWLYSVLVDETVTGIDRDTLAEKLAERGIETRPVFYPLHQQPAYQSAKTVGEYPISERLASQGLSLPTANNIRLEDVDRICHAIRDIVQNEQVFQQYG